VAHTRVVLRRNGSKVGEVTYASESEAVAHAAKMQGAASGLEALLAPATNRKPRRNGAARAVSGSTRPTRTSQVNAYLAAHGFPGVMLHRSARYAYCHFYGGEADDWTDTSVYVPRVSDLTLDGWLSEARICAKTRRNPSIGRGTKHRDTVAEAVTKRLRAQGVAKKEATSRAYAIATAAEQRRQGLRTNPTPIDIASLDFGHFKKTVKIAGYYNVRTGRRFARVASKDGTFVTDVPVADGGKEGSRAKGADAIKRRAYEQLRIHIEPTNWKPSVRVNPSKAGSVAYGGASIRIHAGTYTVLPHGPSFSGPDGFVGAKKWIDTHGA